MAAACGIDAMVHALEAYLSKAASPFSDAMAEKALELIGKNIRAYVADRSNVEAAEGMLVGSLFAGIAFFLIKYDISLSRIPFVTEESKGICVS